MFDISKIIVRSNHYRCECVFNTEKEASCMCGQFISYITSFDRTITFNYKKNVLFVDTLNKQLTIKLAEYMNQNMK